MSERISNLETPTENPQIWGPGFWMEIYQRQLEERAKDMEEIDANPMTYQTLKTKCSY